MENEKFVLQNTFGTAVVFQSETDLMFTSTVGELRVHVPLDFPATRLRYSCEPALPEFAELNKCQSVLEFLTSFIEHFEARFTKKTTSKLELFDSHAHFLRPHFEEFDLDFERVRQNFAGKICIIAAFPTQEMYEMALDTANLSPQYYFSVGIHPYRVQEAEFCFSQASECLQQFAAQQHENQKLVAFGECGFSCAEDDLQMMKAQKRVLELHFQLCERYRKAMIVHAHKAYQLQWVIDEAHKFKGVRGVSHGFGGTPEEARDLAALGWFGSFNPLTSTQQMKKTVKTVGLEFVMLETDSPYSQKGNEPSDVREVAEKLSDAIGERLETVIEKCNKNAAILYNIQ